MKKNFFPKYKSSKLTDGGTLRFMSYKNWITSSLFGDIYDVKLEKTLKKQDPTKVLDLRKKRINTKHYNPSHVVKHVYNSNLHREEILLNEIITKYVLGKKFPHFPITYKTYTTKNAIFRGIRKKGVYKSAGNWEKVQKGSGLISIMEYVGIPLKEYIKKYEAGYISDNDIKGSIGQILLSIYALNNKCNILHNDLYMNNITMKELAEPTLFIYKINGKKYYILSKRYYPIIIDFGQASIRKRKEEYGVDLYLCLSNLSYYIDMPVLNKMIRKLIKSNFNMNEMNEINEEDVKNILNVKYTNGKYMFENIMGELFIKKPKTMYKEYYIELDK